MTDGGDRKPRRRRAKARHKGAFDEQRAVFMISVAAELAEMHPQTLRMYEARGLIAPKRSAKNTRLYSFDDVEQLRRIQQLTAQEGLNLAGVETVLELERQLERARRELSKLRDETEALESAMRAEVDRVKRSFRAEIVPYGAYEPSEIVSARRPSRDGADRVVIPIKRRPRKAT